MKLKFTKFIFSLAILLSFTFIKSNAQQSKTYIFTHANVLPMTKDTVLSDYSVVVKDGKVSKIGLSSKIKIQANATVINAKNKFLIPGLSDMHVHMEGDAWNIMFPPESKFTGDEINYNDILFLYLANGITTIDLLFSSPEHIKLRDKINRKEMLGPRLILSRMIDGAGKAWPPPLGVWVNNPQEAKNAVIEMHQQGYDRVKVYSFLSEEEYDTIIATARRLNMPVDGHVPFASSVEHVLKSGQKMLAHIEEVAKFAKEYNPEQVNYFADMIANSNTWVTSTLILNHNLINLLEDSAREFSKPNTEYLHPMCLGVWKYIYEHIYKPIPPKHRLNLVEEYKLFQKPFVYQFYKKGGKLLTGTDALVPSTIPGFSLHEELKELTDAGLTPYEVLKASTKNPFEFLNELDKAGTIETGKTANLVLLDKNPFEDISNTRRILGVMTPNQWLSKIEIDRRLEKIKKSYSKLRTKKRF